MDVVAAAASKLKRDAVMNVRLPAPLKKALRQAASDDSRTMSGMLVRILEEWMAEHGYLASRVLKARRR